jgi:uncharacterized protein (DUF1778 family)
MSSVAEISARFTSEERQLIEDLAKMRRMTMSDVVRELMGFAREDEGRATSRLHLVSA